MVAGQSFDDKGSWILSKRRGEALSVCECLFLIVVVSKQTVDYIQVWNTLYQKVYINFCARCFFFFSRPNLLITRLNPGEFKQSDFYTAFKKFFLACCFLYIILWCLTPVWPGQVCRWNAASAGGGDASEQAEQHVPGEASRARQ